MRNPEWSALELVVGSGLLVGPLVYALTLEPQRIVVPVETAQPVPVASAVDAPVCEAEPERAEEPAAHPVPEPAGDVGRFMFVTAAGVVLTTDADKAWGRGRVRGRRGGFDADIAAWKRIDPATIPGDLWELRGRELDLYGSHGWICRARLGRLELVAQYSGWQELLLTEEELGDEDSDAVPSKLLRQRVFDNEPAWLVGSIESSQDCSGAMWARDASLPAPTVYAPEALDTQTGWAAELLATARSSDEYGELEQAYRAYLGELDAEQRRAEPSWARFEQEQLDARAWTDDAGHPAFIQLDLYADPESCDMGFYDRFTRSFAVNQDGRSEVAELAVWPDALADIDGDGRLEALFDHGTGISLETESTGFPQDAVVPFAGCPC